MGKGKLQRGTQANKIVQYTFPGQEAGQRTENPHTLEDRPQRQDTQDILEAIRGTRTALQRKMDVMAMDINHLRFNLHKVAKRVTSIEGEVTDLQNKVCTLQATMETLRSKATRMAIRVEDATEWMDSMGMKQVLSTQNLGRIDSGFRRRHFESRT
ncbi:hypothetical protein NDU88_005573 [Pleurodeles waltl]|uniref:Uncharacterized protein n=1 Tax=Pleurodeles waltl TaxID=8319 RepID=A0AAV7MF08_PLEWA|nr:hypothetical protein NDU88_005573 [Pleurodeles waltl]